MQEWLYTNNANKINQTFINGFVDISGGDIINRNNDLFIGGNSCLNKNLNVNGTASITNNMYIDGDAFINGNINIPIGNVETLLTRLFLYSEHITNENMELHNEVKQLYKSYKELNKKYESLQIQVSSLMEIKGKVSAFSNTTGSITMNKTFTLNILYSVYIQQYGLPEYGVGFDPDKLNLVKQYLRDNNIPLPVEDMSMNDLCMTNL